MHFGQFKLTSAHTYTHTISITQNFYHIKKKKVLDNTLGKCKLKLQFSSTIYPQNSYNQKTKKN